MILGSRLAPVALVLVSLIAATTEAIDVDDFYPFNKNSDLRLPRSDAVWSPEIHLSVPINFYNRTHSSVWVHTDGFVSFSAEAVDISSMVDTDFPLYDSLIAPYMANLDTTEQGHIVYEESQLPSILARASIDVQNAFPEAGKSFTAQSVFIATWKNVKGFSLEGLPASFTFQLVIVSSDVDSYAIFLYPKRKMGSMEVGEVPRTNMFEAKAGFNMGGQKFLEMYPAEDLVDYDNTRRKGEWIFQIGGKGVVSHDDVIDPERRRLVRRDALVNVQEVDLSDSFNEDDIDQRGGSDRFFDYCARDGGACMVNNSICVNHNDGYCCQCQRGYVGNGRICADAYQNLMISGNVTGTVDIRSQDGSVNRVKVNSAFEGFSIVDLGRSHAALTPVPYELGAALKAIVPVGEISAWLFASSNSPAINGFDYTGGRFQRQLSIRYRDGGYRFDMRQRFHGAYFSNDELFVNATGHCVGVLPSVSLDQIVNVDDIESTYIREAPGRITMSATHSYVADGKTYVYDVSETIIFSECADSRNAVPSQLTLKMSNVFVQADQSTVRWAQDAKVTVSDGATPIQRSHRPCDDRTLCGVGECVPSGTGYRCRCPSGYEEVFDGQGSFSCEEAVEVVTDYNLDPCDIDGICGPGTCVSVGNTFTCQCPPGYLAVNDNGYGSCQESVIEEYDPCEDNDCGVGGCVADGEIYICECPQGYHEYTNENGFSSCQQYNPTEVPTTDDDTCQDHECGVGTCIARQNGYRCQCPHGYRETRNSEGKATCEVQLPGLQKPCEVAGICGRVGQCRADGSSYRCDCPTGYVEVQDTYGSRCEDINECTESGNICSPYANCNNYDGSYECECQEGYTGDGKDCQPGADSPCERERQYAEERRRGNNLHVPICTSDGRYERKQCNEEVCWCVNEDTGSEIRGSRSQPGDGDYVRCDEYSAPRRETECERLYRQSVEYKEANPNSDIEYPDCTSDGLFNKRQCAGFGDTCWCVDPSTGDEIEGTRSASRRGLELDCENLEPDQPETECQRQYREVDEMLLENPNIQDLEHPSCGTDGLFHKRQCVYFLDICRCVDENTGETIEGTLTGQGEGHTLNCDAAREPSTETECMRQYRLEHQRSIANPSTRVHVPDCNADGTFIPRQCDLYDDSCWCVDVVTGEEVHGTRTAAGRGMSLSCENDAQDPCDQSPCGVGTCVVQHGRQRCYCPDEYSEVATEDGRTCEADDEYDDEEVPVGPSNLTDEEFEGCDIPSPCGEVGECVEIPNSHHRCRCPEGYREYATDLGSRCRAETTTTLPTTRKTTTTIISTTTTTSQQPTTTTTTSSEFEGCDIPSPCGEVGECVEIPNSHHRCRCPEGYREYATLRGSRCRAELIVVNESSSPSVPTTNATGCNQPNPCGAVGECVERPDTYHRCRCPEGYVEVPGARGSKCEEADGVCENIQDPCSGKGTCVPARGTYRCRCDAGYTEYFVDGHGDCQPDSTGPCSDNPCGPNGECVPAHTSHRCRCGEGYQEHFLRSGSSCVPIEGSGDPTEPTEPTETACMKKFRESLRDRNGPRVECTEDGNYKRKQCDDATYKCWCVDPIKGLKIDNTETEAGEGFSLYCEDSDPTSTQSTACLDDKFMMQAHYQDPSAEKPFGLLYEPDCTEYGAYEPMQYHDGYYICVDFNGLEVSRHKRRPQCLRPCDLAAYYKQTENIFTGRENYVPHCDNDGEYEPVQCEGDYCYCVDSNGNEVQDTRTFVTNRNGKRRMEYKCKQAPTTTTTKVTTQTTTPHSSCDSQENPCGEVGECVDLPTSYHRCRCPQGYDEILSEHGSKCELTIPEYEPSPPKQVIFAQATGLQVIDLPWTSESHANRLYERPRRMFVGVDYDCKSKHVYFTDVRERTIYRSPVDDFNYVETIVRDSLRSPEGVAFDHVSGNLYWADSGTKRIEVSKPDGSMRAVIVSKGLVNPRGIAVNPSTGKMYWSDWNRKNPRIMVANMDGSDPKVFVKEGLRLPNNVEIDMYHKKLCFIDAGTNKIECIDLNGNNRHVVADLNQGATPRMAFGLEVSGRYVYYTDRKAARIHQVDMETGEDLLMRGPMGVHGQMFGITLSYDDCPKENNSCARNNGGCDADKLCLPVPDGRVCKCPRGSKNCVENK